MEVIFQIVKEDSKDRYEISNDKTKIRALYGRSIPIELDIQPVVPLDILYHGTTEMAFSSITSVGIMPRSRNFVHLSDDTETAWEVVKRHSKNILIVQIDAKKMLEDGYSFFNPVDHTWLVKQVLKDYLYSIFLSRTHVNNRRQSYNGVTHNNGRNRSQVQESFART